jgi:hypothetical protein
MDVTKPCKFIGFGAMDVTKAYKIIGGGAMDVTMAYKFMGFGLKRRAARQPGRPAQSCLVAKHLYRVW